MNPIIIIALVIVLGIFVYTQFIAKDKTYCKITIFDRNGDMLIKHKGTYNGVLKSIRNETGTKLSWIKIKKLKENIILPKIKWLIITQKYKHLFLVRLSKNRYEILKPKIEKYDYQAVKINDKVYYKRQEKPKARYNLEKLNDDLTFEQMELEDTLNTNYQMKASLLEKLKPYYVLGIIVLIAIVAMNFTYKTNVETAANVKETSQELSSTAKLLTNVLQGVSNDNPNTEVGTLPKEDEPTKKGE